MSIDPTGTGVDERPLASPTVRQFVIFLVADETYAVPLAEVQEIIRLPEMVGVPLSPAALANLRGAVLPSASLRRIFALPDHAHDDATRVVVISQETPFGFVVDRMSSVVTCELGDIDGTEGLQATVDTDMLSGIIRRPDGMITIIAPARLMQPSAGTRPARGSERVETLADAGSTRSAETVSDEIQLVSSELAGQEYALPIEHVQEIVQVPATVNAVPKADPSVVGVINLRDRLLPLVSLRRLFGLNDPDLSEHSRIVVVSWSGSGADRSVGIVTNTVKEVLRVSRSIADPVPELLSGGGSLREVEAIYRINNGKRLVSILSAERLFDTATRLEGAAAHFGEMGMDGERSVQKAEEEEQFVVFRLAGEEYGVLIDSVHEIVRVPEQLTRVLRTPRFTEGVVNLRGAVLPVVDQRRRFQLPDTERNDRQRIMVFMIEDARTGFIVDSVSEVLAISRSVIAPAPDLGQDDRAVDRIANFAERNRIILMLDVGRLLSRSEVADLRDAA